MSERHSDVSCAKKRPRPEEDTSHVEGVQHVQHVRRLRFASDCSGLETPLLALRALGVQVEHKFSSDIDPQVRQHIAANFAPEILYADCMNRNNRSDGVPQSDLYCAGWPCQPWSLAGGRLGFGDRRGSVFHGVVDYIQAKRPTAYVLENVPGVLSHAQGKSWKTILRILTTMNDGEYCVKWQLLESSMLGLPQCRRRLYIIGMRKDRMVQGCEFEWPQQPVPESDHLDLEQVLDPLETPEIDINDVGQCIQELGVGPARALWLLKGRVQRREIDPNAEVVMDLDSSLDRCRFMTGKSPCLLKSRARGYFLLRRGRRMRWHEMLRLQGISPPAVKAVSDAALGAMAGNAMSQRVLELLFSRLLLAVGLHQC